MKRHWMLTAVPRRIGPGGALKLNKVFWTAFLAEPIPEPATLSLLALGVLGISLRKRSGNRTQACASANLESKGEREMKSILYVMMTAAAAAILAISATVSVAAAPDTDIRHYLLGDTDGFSYDGPGSVDDVYCDPIWLSYFNQNPSPDDDFDVLAYNHDVGFTFEYPLAPHETVTGATLTVGLRAVADASTDVIYLDGRLLEDMPTFEDVGWLPVPDTGVAVRQLDLSSVLDRSFLPALQDGQFNVQIRDDVAVDYAQLTIEVIPEPITASLLAIGLAAVIGKRKNRYPMPSSESRQQKAASNASAAL